MVATDDVTVVVVASIVGRRNILRYDIILPEHNVPEASSARW